MAEKIQTAGGRIHYKTSITSIDTDGYRITSLGASDQSKIPVDKADVIISSIPITTAARLLGYESKLHFRGIRLCYVAVNKGIVIPGRSAWLYYDSENVFFNRVTESKKLTPYIAPVDKSVLTVETAYSAGDDVDHMSNSDFENRIVNDLVKVGLLNHNEVIATDSCKEPYVYPVQDKHFKYELAKTRAAIDGYSQFYSLGTGGGFNYADSQILFHI